jgi:glycosyltransferase involved in cell wall biosynthesis
MSSDLKALVVHPQFSIFGGGEYVCLNVISALRKSGYDVTLLSSDYDEEGVRRAFPFEKPELRLERLSAFDPIFPKATALQRVWYARGQRKKLRVLYAKHDIIFHTQTATFLGPSERRTFNIFYDPTDITIKTASGWKKPYYGLVRKLLVSNILDAINIPLSKSLEDYLEQAGYPHTSYVYPPCDMSFRPREKRKQVIQVTRIVPGKRLDLFIEIARRLRQYHFLLVGSLSEAQSKLHPGYAKKLLDDRSDNVEYLEMRIKDCPERLEESAVYLHTSVEPGISIATTQGVGAGCIPVTPCIGGGSEIVKTVGAGYCYQTVVEAAERIRQSIENPRWTPIELSERAQIFNAESFQRSISAKIEKAFPVFSPMYKPHG